VADYMTGVVKESTQSGDILGFDYNPFGAI
jgi:hypothetical protein